MKCQNTWHIPKIGGGWQCPVKVEGTERIVCSAAHAQSDVHLNDLLSALRNKLSILVLALKTVRVL